MIVISLHHFTRVTNKKRFSDTGSDAARPTGRDSQLLRRSGIRVSGLMLLKKWRVWQENFDSWPRMVEDDGAELDWCYGCYGEVGIVAPLRVKCDSVTDPVEFERPKRHRQEKILTATLSRLVCPSSVTGTGKLSVCTLHRCLSSNDARV